MELMTNQTLSNYIEVPRRFHRSINIVQDSNNEAALSGYVVTPFTHELARTIATAILEPHGSRAWSIVGPFGAGKSAFGTFLLDVLSRESPVIEQASSIRSSAGLGPTTWKPILLTGQRRSFGRALIDKLRSSIESNAADASEEANIHHEDDILAAVDGLLDELISRHQRVVLLIDEFGKFLEYSVLDSTKTDLFVLQHLAERAARSNGNLVLLTIQHSSFASYADTAGTIATNEWRKIQGRFTDVPFYLPVEQMLALMDQALTHNFPFDLQRWYEDRLQVLRQCLPTSNAIVWKRVNGLLPLHPVTALLMWPIFRSKLAQNERSLFAFLCSQEPFGFNHFLQQVIIEPENRDFDGFYRLADLFDYVTTALGSAVVLGEHASRFAEAINAIDRLPKNAPRFALPLIKSVLLMNLFGAQARLSASREYLSLMVGDGISWYEEEIGEAVDYLVKRSVLVYRSHRNEYSLWEGSDVDLNSLVTKAERAVTDTALGDLIQELVPNLARVARGHYVRTGTLRYYDVVLVVDHPDQAWPASQKAIAQSAADGLIVLFLAPSENAYRTISNRLQHAKAEDLWTEEVGFRPLITGVSRFVSGATEAARNLAAWKHVRMTAPQLESDRVARSEVDARIREATLRLELILGSLLGLPGHRFDPGLTNWFVDGKGEEFHHHRDFLDRLSNLCDEVYSKAPSLHNELLNRSTLSSAAAKARRNLLESMLEHGHLERLGLKGNPPEVAMYTGALLASGIHAKRGDDCSFSAPENKAWVPIWNAIATSLRASKNQVLPVQQLATLLSRPPYGLRKGPFPVLLLAYMLTFRSQIAVYEMGTYVPVWRIEVFERMMRRPADFTLRWIDEDARTVRVLEELRSITLSGQADSARLVDVVRPLIVTVAQLPAYARHTRRFDDLTVVRVREAILRAQDPVELVFRELPSVLNSPLSELEGSERQFAIRLKEVVDQLRFAYPRLVEEVSEALVNSLGLYETDPRAELRLRAQRVIRFGGDKRLKTFLLESQRTTSSWAEGLGRAIMDGNPPDSWKDVDVTTFHARLRMLVQDFFRLEELAESQEEHHGVPILRMDYLHDKHEHILVPLRPSDDSEKSEQQLILQIQELLLSESRSSTGSKTMRMNILARLLLDEIRSEPVS